MGVECTLTVFAETEHDGRIAARTAFARAETIEQVISSWRPGSEANEVASRGGEASPLSSELCTLLATSLRWSKDTDGAFDPTIYHSIRLWAAARQSQELPAREAIAAAHAKGGWQGVVFDQSACEVRISTEGLRFDFGGIGKGFAADEMLCVLGHLGFDRALVEIGGDVVASGPPPGKEAWRVRIEGSAQVIELSHGAVATSGDSAQALELNGVRYSHIIDPKTGEALAQSVPVTVIVRGGNSPGADADALASAASVIAARLMVRRRSPLGS